MPLPRPAFLPLRLALVILALACTPAAAEEFSSLEERMSHREFVAAGLDKLTPEELAALNQWLRESVREATTGAAQTAAIAAVTQRRQDRVGFERAGMFGSRDAADSVSSRIKGEFRGWERKGQRFVLENGQVWEVTEVDRPLLGVRLEDPLAFIESGFSGAWYLRVEGYNARVKVKRIK